MVYLELGLINQISLLALMQTPEWKKFKKADIWMTRYRLERVDNPQFDSKWREHLARFEVNILAPLEKKWRMIQNANRQKLQNRESVQP